ncbi:hypothetical protein [Niabella beijingensis]|uniref:hypothetical protein n=1 Tax=Niabella beijingensis TaxID=2872700 RepID=UPI001CBFD133|nr:hypothetical protein [Niabella beijingensis]MBZ4192070.1 hypothetical protein [Niabella beijingensis]
MINNCLILCLIFVCSCSVAQKQIVVYPPHILITNSKQECGSIEVKNNGRPIGYIVKPFIGDTPDKENQITVFEKLLHTTHDNFYNKFYRVYTFISNTKGEQTLEVVMLTNKQTTLISDWKCELQDVDTYMLGRRNTFSPKYPQFFTYICSKGRFKTINDPD